MPSEELSETKAKGLVKNWMKEISDAMKREKKYREQGQKCVKLYEAKNPDQVPFNILYSNTETLIPAVYNARPIPIVTRRYKDVDPVGKAVAETSTRTLKFLIDNEGRDFDPYDDIIQAAVLDCAVTNRGITRFKYKPPNEYWPECVYGEAVRWDKFFHGYARSWKKVPWIGFEWDMSKDELKKNFPKAKLADLRFTANQEDSDGEEKAEDRDELAGVKTYKVYEIWDKITSKVLFISPCCPEEPLRYIDDPLGLSGFFPIPRPLNFMRKITTLVPTPLFQQYAQQANELNELTRRLKAVIKAIKVRGMYNAAVEGIEKMLTADDNEVVPVENMQSMPDGSAMDKVIWMVPVENLVQTAQSLYQQRESCKQVIYEITGISDILRGASVASETATAQNIKNQWGTLRLKKMQKEVQRYCREALAIMLEIAAARFEIKTFQQMTGLPFLTEQQKGQIKQQIQMAQMQAQTMGQQAPQPPQLPPEVMQALAAPSWEQIEQVMQSDVTLHYKTDIETNSTIDAEAAQDKQDIAELMNAVSQFLNGIAPLVEKGAMSIDVAKAMLLTISRRFNFGTELEDALNNMKAPEPQTDPAAEAKAQAEQAKAGVEQAKATAEMEKIKLEAGVAQQEFNNERAIIMLKAQVEQAKLDIEKQELELQRQGMAMKAEFQREQHRIKMEGLRAKEKEPANA